MAGVMQYYKEKGMKVDKRGMTTRFKRFYNQALQFCIYKTSGVLDLKTNHSPPACMINNSLDYITSMINYEIETNIETNKRRVANIMNGDDTEQDIGDDEGAHGDEDVGDNCSSHGGSTSKEDCKPAAM